MDKLRMQSTNGVQENIEKIQSLFPDCVTETIDERTGELVRKVDFEKLQQNLSDVIISGREERYQFTWPDKKKAILLANSLVNAALRPCRIEKCTATVPRVDCRIRLNQLCGITCIAFRIRYGYLTI